jgi:hypothetical protein
MSRRRLQTILNEKTSRLNIVMKKKFETSLDRLKSWGNNKRQTSLALTMGLYITNE